MNRKRLIREFKVKGPASGDGLSVVLPHNGRQKDREREPFYRHQILWVEPLWSDHPWKAPLSNGSCISAWVLEGSIHSDHCNIQYTSSPPTVAPCVTVTMALWSKGTMLPSSVTWNTGESQNWSVSICHSQACDMVIITCLFYFWLPLDFWTLRILVLRGSCSFGVGNFLITFL